MASGLGVYAGIVPLEGSPQTPLLSRMRTGMKHRIEVQRGGEIGRLGDDVGGAIIGTSLHRLRGADCTEPVLDAVQHHVSDHLAGDASAAGGDPGDALAVMGVDAKGDTEHFAVPTGDLEVIGSPALIGCGRDEGTLLGADRPPAGVGLKKR